MGYFPESRKGRKAYRLLRRNADRHFFGTEFRTPIKRKHLRELMLAYYCPVVCVGVVNGAGWHKNCETAVDNALAILDGNHVVKG
jgi:hypothetical protein